MDWKTWRDSRSLKSEHRCPLKCRATRLYGTSSAIPGSSLAIPGSSRAIPGSSRAIPGSSRAIPGSSPAIPGSSLTSSLSRVVRDGWDPCPEPLSGWKKSLMRWRHRLGRWTAILFRKLHKNKTIPGSGPAIPSRDTCLRSSDTWLAPPTRWGHPLSPNTSYMLRYSYSMKNVHEHEAARAQY